jgi:hypothetical protein
MEEDIAGLRHDMEMQIENLRRDFHREIGDLHLSFHSLKAGYEMQIAELGETLQQHMQNGVRVVEQVKELADRMSEFITNFNQHGHSVDDVVYSQHITSKPVKADG